MSKPQTLCKAEYIWLDGASPTQQLRSKTRIVPISGEEPSSAEDFPIWGFDGSSTGQAEGNFSDVELKPVYFCPDPIRGGDSYLVMCETYDADGETPHESNTRATLRDVLARGGAEAEALVGFEQEYTLYEGNRPVGFPIDGVPAPQFQYYCAVGAQNIFGRDVMEDHMECCLAAGLAIYGTNAEVMPGQWEFQIGYRGVEGESADVLTLSDQLHIARWMLQRVAEEYGLSVSFLPKPAKGDWNGAGMHTNFSTKATRASGGMEAIQEAIGRLEKAHEAHIAVYGDGNEERLTGDHETCSITQFRSGVSDRGASIRIPMSTSQKGYGYFEDRRPAANADPYQVGTMLLSTVCGIELGKPSKVTKMKAA